MLDEKLCAYFLQKKKKKVLFSHFVTRFNKSQHLGNSYWYDFAEILNFLILNMAFAMSVSQI